MTGARHRPAAPLVTRQSLRADLARLGVGPGATLLVHASLRRLGWVCGGATTVVLALRDAVGPEGTIVAPTQTLDNRDPSRWAHNPVPEAWWPVIREHLPPFDPEVTPSTGMGAVAERIRTWPGAVRSAHPLTSLAAIGARAPELMAGHPVESLLGAESPLGGLKRAGAGVLLLGVGFDKCTAFHLAEYRLPRRRLRCMASVMQTPHGPEWVSYVTTELDDRDFGRLGRAFERESGSVARGKVGAATGRLLPIRAAVRFAAAWLLRHRLPGPGGPTGGYDESGNR